MSAERLTDEELTECEQMLRPLLSLRATAMVSELRALRLSDEDREALRWLLKHLAVMQMPGVPPRRDKAQAIAVLTRLIGGEP